MDYSITQYGKALAEDLYIIDFDTKVFSSTEDFLVIDCGKGWTFKTGDSCMFGTGGNCTFTTGHSCTFKTGNNCTFSTGGCCTFGIVGSNSTFNTGAECTFMLWGINTCTFKSSDGISIILDIKDNKHYILDKEFVHLQKILKG